MAEKYVSMIHKKTGNKITGVHPDSVKAHEEIGYQVVDEPEVKKTVKPDTKAADNDTLPVAEAPKGKSAGKNKK